MKILKPKPLELISSSLTGSAYSEWSNAGVSYSVGARVKVTTTYAWADRDDYSVPSGYEAEYECLVAHTSTADNGPEDDDTNWLLLGASNRYKMFDNYTSTQSVAPSGNSLVVVVKPNTYIDTMALFGLQGATVQVRALDSSGLPRFSETRQLWSDEYDVTNAFEYCFSGFDFIRDMIFNINILISSLSYEVTVTPSSTKAAACGHIVLGKYIELGRTVYSPQVGIDDYSAKSVNDFGETYLQRRSYAKTAQATISINTSDFSKVAGVLADARSTPCLYQLNNDTTSYDPLIIYGYYKDFTETLDGPHKSTLNIEIEGLI